MSTNTGLAPTYRMQLAEATKEKGVVMTSCPGPTPAAIIAQCSPAVPDETADARAAARELRTGASNLQTSARSKASACAARRHRSISRCVMSGWERGIAIVIVNSSRGMGLSTCSDEVGARVYRTKDACGMSSRP